MEYNWRNSKATFGGKILAGVEIISFDDETMVGLARVGNALVRFEARSIQQPYEGSDYANVVFKYIGDKRIEIQER